MYHRLYLRTILRSAGRRKKTVVCCAVFLLLVVFVLFNWRDFGYVTRPLWDQARAPRPWTLIKRFDHPQIPIVDLCAQHGWTARPNAVSFLMETSQVLTDIIVDTEQQDSRNTLKVWDATLFSFEVDLLEIRFRELWDVVDHFIIIESDRTFTGKPKPMEFCSLRHTEQFKWAESKIIYEQVELLSMDNSEKSPADTAWHNEAAMRGRINSVLTQSGVKNGDLIIQSDVDEIPSRSTIDLVRTCQGFADTLHLSLQSFIYSFAFTLPKPTTVASVKTYNSTDGWYYSHQRKSNDLLEDAGWHCSFCFRYLADFRDKMTGFSHFDRVTSPGRQLENSEIQQKICEGRDIFDMFPEVYTFRDMLLEFTGTYPETTSFSRMPVWLLKNPQRFAFLLPGGCQREVETDRNSTCLSSDAQG